MLPIQGLLLTTFLLGALSLSTQQKHFMYALLCIEAMMLSMFTIMTLSTNNMTYTTNMPTPIMLLTLAACEASVGLSILIATIRTHGMRFMSNLNML
uniref:NADH-ubiquinone oxidoreductase chain 4L n=1 Tax=Amerotyphlops reticulatus TaxID=534403 RepID=B3GT24_9SAUR|nr:NADH dehydrogenase subunit 4L [Amerotyphlops reticulatus]ACD85894.1 NADH dehydrogenase subunit 4L [Amerotyphlops reticulatus]